MAEPTLLSSNEFRKRDGRGICSRCGGQARATTKHQPLCTVCRRTCITCGGIKSERGRGECIKCLSLHSADYFLAMQPMASAMGGAVMKANTRRFADIADDCFTNTMKSGRWSTKYTDDDGQVHGIYRYQWRWIKAFGEIPDGYHVHHKNHDHADDRLENLELMPGADHYKMHGLSRRKETWPCEQCGKQFRRMLRGKRKRFCSLACYRTSLAERPRTKTVG